MKRSIYLLFLIFFACTAPHTLDATATLNGTITDSVTGLPISGALVEANRGGVVRYSDNTLANGVYTMSGVEPSNYTLVASAPGYQTQSVGVKPPNNQITTVDFALVPNGGTISGTITDDITMLPIPAAVVNIFQGTTLIVTVVANGAGVYSAPNLAPGNYVVRATATSYRTALKGANVQIGVTTVVDFALAAFPGTISGTVTDSGTMSPIQGALVEVYDGSFLVGFADTDAMGNYTIGSLAPGTYTVVASAEGYSFQNKDAIVIASMTTTVDFALDTILGTIAGTVADSSTGSPLPGVTIKVFQRLVNIATVQTDINGNYNISGFSPGNYTVIASLNGYQIGIAGASVLAHSTTIVNFSLSANPGTVEGTVIDSVTMNPIAGAIIQVRSGPVLIATALTDPNGNYSIPNLEPNTYSVIAGASGYQVQVKSITVFSSQATTADFALNPNPGTISGTVTDAITTNPIPGASVNVYQGTNLVGFSQTDVNGNYTIANLAPGNYFVVASADGYQTKFSANVVVASMTTTVDFALDASPGAIAGTITETCAGNPLSGALIVVTDGSVIVGFDVTDASGDYLVSGLAPGSYTVAVAKKNFLFGSSMAVVVSSATTTVDLSLTPQALSPATITGTVKNNKFLSQTDRIHALSWSASPGLCVIGYNVFRNGVLIAFVPSAGKLQYLDHDRGNKTDVYSIQTVNSFGLVSTPVIITVP